MLCRVEDSQMFWIWLMMSLKIIFLGGKVAISVVLDGDVREQAEKYVNKKNLSRHLPISYLPIPSLEKYLRQNLFLHVDHNLFRFLTNYLFQHKSLEEIIEFYKKDQNSHYRTDDNGKAFFKLIEAELKQRNKNRAELVGMVVDYLFDTNDKRTIDTADFLKKQLNDFDL